MKFQTTILDRNGAEWSFSTEQVEGKVVYEADEAGWKNGYTIEDFGMTGITLELNGVKIQVENINGMPDIFNEIQIDDVRQEAFEAILSDWMNVQDCAHDLLNP